MTIDERLKDSIKRLNYISEVEKPNEDEWRQILKTIITASRQDGIEEARKACAEIACMVKEELSQRPEKLQYGRTQIEVAGYIETEIRALPL